MRRGDEDWMRHAIALGARGLGRVWPNPAVGCVLVNGDRVVGRGWTAPGGRPHAEVLALAQAGAAARGATAHVSLEPCSHHGQTGPCAEALIAAGVARVVAACEDPDPRVAGAGLARLRAAGVAVASGIGAAQAQAVHEGFFRRVRQGRPMLTLKLALTLDGKIATEAGESRWITGPEARARVHLMRARHDAVMVGAGTARADDPELTVRGLGLAAQPVRVVVSSRLGLSPDGALGRSAGEVPVWLLHGAGAPASARATWEARGARLIEVPVAPGGGVGLAAALAALGAAGLTRVLCEGGGVLAAGLLQSGLVDRLAIFSAGLMLGAEARPGIGALGVTALALAPRWHPVEQERLGRDLLSHWRPLGSDAG